LKKNKISKNWINKQRRDTYVRQSKVDGYRARSAYKLIEIDEKFKVFKGGISVIDIGAAPGAVAPIYTYSLSKGLYAGLSFDGKIITVRDRVNEKFYGRDVNGMDFLLGQIPTPPAARPLYDALQRCHVYATGNTRIKRHKPTQPRVPMEYGELSPPIMPPARNDQHSYAGMSDITADQGY